MTEGISRAIGELAAAQRLSATSVMVTSPHWPATAPRLAVHRGHLSIGLHLNLTLGRPLGPMPRLAACRHAAEPQPPHGLGLAASAGPDRDPRRDRAPARSLRDRPALSARPHRRPPARACAAGRQGCAARRGGAALRWTAAAGPRSDGPALRLERTQLGSGQGHIRRAAGHRASRARPDGAGCPSTTPSPASPTSAPARPTPTSSAPRCASPAGGTS